MRESPIQITLTVHLVLSIDPTEQYPLAAVAEFLTEQRIESTLLEALIERLNEVFVEAYVVKNTHAATGTSNSNALPPVLARKLPPLASTNSPLITSKTPLLTTMNPLTSVPSKTSLTSMGRDDINRTSLLGPSILQPRSPTVMRRLMATVVSDSEPRLVTAFTLRPFLWGKYVEFESSASRRRQDIPCTHPSPLRRE